MKHFTKNKIDVAIRRYKSGLSYWRDKKMFYEGSVLGDIYKTRLEIQESVIRRLEKLKSK